MPVKKHSKFQASLLLPLPGSWKRKGRFWEQVAEGGNPERAKNEDLQLLVAVEQSELPPSLSWWEGEMPLALRLGFPPRTLPTAVHFRVICFGVRWGALFRLIPPACPPTRLLHRACGSASASWCAVCREKALRPG